MPGSGGYEAIVDSLERQASYSLFVNNAWSRTLLSENMEQAADSLTYYRLMGIYSKACFATAQFDSVFFYNHKILRFCLGASETPQIHDLISAANNMSGNVWVQRSMPDSAIACYKRAYEHRKSLRRISVLTWPMVTFIGEIMRMLPIIIAGHYSSVIPWICPTGISFQCTTAWDKHTWSFVTLTFRIIIMKWQDNISPK